MKLSESLVVYQQAHKAKRLHLNLKVCTDDAVLRSIGVPNSSDLKEATRLIQKYLDSNVTLLSTILKNPLEQLEAALSTGDYTLQEGVYTYNKILPGFNSMCLSFSHYQDYIKTKYEDYQAYRLKIIKTQDINDLPGITLSKDNELVFIVEGSISIVTQIGLMLDNLKTLIDQYSTMLEKVKATCFDVEQNKVQKLAELDIDSHLKNFIQFKLASELCSIAIEVGIEFITGIMTVFSELIELDQ